MEINKTQNPANVSQTGFKSAPKGEPVEKIQEFLSNFINRAEFELSDVGYFRAISSEFVNDNPLRYVGTVKLTLSPENSSTKCKNRILEAFVTDETGKYETTKVLKEGGRGELLEYLKSGNAARELEDYITRTSDRFFTMENM